MSETATMEAVAPVTTDGTATEAAPAPAPAGPLKGLGKIPMGDLPKAFKSHNARHLKGLKKEPFKGKKLRPWFFYTEASVGTQPNGEPNPPGLFAIYWVPDADQGGNYTKTKEIRLAGGCIINEFAAIDVVNGSYTAEDWAGIQWAARKALGVKVGDHPTRQKVKRTKKTKFYRGLLVAVNKKLKTGEYSVEFLEHTHECNPTLILPPNSRANIPGDCLTDDRQSSLEIETPELTLTHARVAAAQTPYTPRFDLGAFEDVE